MKKQIHILLLIFFTTLSYSQNEAINYPNFVGKDLTSIQKNKDWVILDQVSGHLNNDLKKDKALVIESKDSVNEKRCDHCDISKSKARIVLVLLHEKGKLIVHSQNNEFIPRADEGRKELEISPIIVIENNEFIIFQQYVRDFFSYKFKLQDDQFNIVRATTIESDIHMITSNKYDFIKGTITQKTNRIASKKEKIKMIKFNVKSKSLSEFKQMHEWKIAEYFYL